jgi:hypothetical protein
VGWATLIKTVVLILAPRMLRAYADMSEKTLATWLRMGGVFWVLAGGIIIYFSHVAG